LGEDGMQKDEYYEAVTAGDYVPGAEELLEEWAQLHGIYLEYYRHNFDEIE
jgi:hypothetical protein